MGRLDFLLGDESSSNEGNDYDRSVFDTDRFRKNGSGNWIDWKMLAQGTMMATALSTQIMTKTASGN